MNEYSNNPEVAMEALKNNHSVFALFRTDIEGKYFAKPCTMDYVSELKFETDQSDEEDVYADYYSGFLTFMIKNREVYLNDSTNA
jgi:hypothetical protein